MTKKKKLVSVLFVDEKTGENNKLVLKFEIRKMSQKSLEIIIYSPFLILNETEFTLFYRSGKNISKMNEDIMMMDYDWTKKIESLTNDQELYEESTTNHSEVFNKNKTAYLTRKMEVTERVISMLEMFGPEEGPKTLQISKHK